ncbi:MAG TPA: ABC transporter ATP-binding protein [Candidatus Angelobacter sp.]|jgi:branched-chain amino acid transport system ATP-binding protein|nr:ABC transporter ATP-binding protein [Candidatus Angelobacter sp.]
MSADTVLLELRDVRAGFGSQTVLHGVSLQVREGEIAGIFGLNGAGKSVTMKVVAGIVPARRGDVVMDGRNITTVAPEDRVALGMAHVPQGRQVFPGLTVEQNLRLGGYRLRRRDKRRYGEALQRTLDRFPILAERRAQLAGSMSGGQQASLAVARALVSDPRIVLVDEPSAGLAPKTVEELFETLREVNRSGVTMLMVEQNVTFGLRLVDTANIMQRGRIVYAGPVADLDQERVAEHLGVGRLLGRGLSAAVQSHEAAAR